MSIQLLSSVFNKTINPEKQQDLKDAENILNQYATEPGFMQHLMILSNTADQSIFIRQAAAAHLKLIIQKHWNNKIFLEQDKVQVRSSLLEALIISLQENKIKQIYMAIIEKISSYDFPKSWNNCDQILSKINNPQNQAEFYAALLMFSCIIKCFKLYMGEDRKDVDPIIEQFLPILALASKQLITNGSDLESIKLIFKTVYTTVMINLPEYFQNQQNIQYWMGALFNILNSPFSGDLNTKQTEELDLIKAKNVAWKIKIKSAQILQRFIQKIKKSEEQKKNQFSSYFLDTYAQGFLEIFVKILSKKEFFQPEKMIFTSLRYILCAIQIKQLFSFTQSYLLQFITDICVPMIKLSQKDILLCQKDQEEYIRKQENYYYNSQMVASDIIQIICKKPDSNNKLFLFSFLKYINENMGTPDPFEKDMYMQAFGLICTEVENQLKKKKSIISDKDIESMLQQFIIPNLQSQNHFLRARACYIISKYSFIEFSDKNNITNSVKSVCQCIQDPELHVRIHASVTINHLLSQDETVDMLRPELTNILTTYVKLMNQIDNEGVVLALEGIVQKFQKEVSPYAIDLVNQLALAFQIYAKKSDQNFNKLDDDDYDGSTEMTAASCLNTIKSILNGQLQADAYLKITVIMIPVFNYVLSNDGSDYIHEGAEILNSILYHSSSIDNNLWFYFPTICYILLGVQQSQVQSLTTLNLEQMKILIDSQEPWGQDYLDQLSPILKNFIQKGFNQIISDKDYFGNPMIELIFAIVTKFQNIANNGNSTENLSQSYSILIALIENGQNKIDFLMERIIILLINNLKKNKYELTIKMEVLSVCFWNNPKLVLQILNKMNFTELIFKSWIEVIPKLQFDYQKSRALWALTSIISLNREEIPIFIISGIQSYMQQITKLTTDVLENREKDDKDSCYDDDDDQEDDLDMLDQALEIKGNKIELGRFDDKDLKEEAIIQNQSDDFNDDDEFRDEILYDSPLDEKCEILFLRDTLEQIQKTRNDLYQIILSQISQENLQVLQKNFQTAQEQDIEYQKNKLN